MKAQPFKMPGSRPEGPALVFPVDSCCNCGTTADLRIIQQDTRRTQYLLVGGSETTYRLPLSFCGRCAPTAKRRRATPLHRLLVFGLAYFGVFAVLLFAGIASGSERLLENTGWLSAVPALVLCAAWYGTRRPQSGQSSYYQPVRIAHYRQPFLSVPGRGIALAFSSPRYARSFEAANPQAVAAGLVQVQHPGNRP